MPLSMGKVFPAGFIGILVSGLLATFMKRRTRVRALALTQNFMDDRAMDIGEALAPTVMKVG